jgi:hypothetical protein
MSDVVNDYSVNCMGYADDHSLYSSFCAGDRVAETLTISNIEDCLQAVNTWMCENRLKMNNDKTELVYFGSSGQLIKKSTNSLSVNNIVINNTHSVKYLGAWLEENLSFSKHINEKCKIASYNLYNISIIRKYLNENACRTIVQALVISHIDYGNCLLYGLPNKELQKLQRIQNMAAKICLKRYKSDSSRQALKDLHWLPVKYRINFKIAVIVFKCLRGLAPEYLTTLVKPKIHARSLRSVASNLLHIPRTNHVTFGDRSFSVAGPTVWNCLPPDVKDSQSLEIFKKKLKTYYFGQAFM